LQANPNDRGVDRPGGKYNNTFWADLFTPADGYDCTFYVPYMAGYTGNIIALMPNGVTYYYFSDNRDFDWHDAVREANKIAPMCPRGGEIPMAAVADENLQIQLSNIP
jgi:hypothetical protein